jgi:hypothetical protein
LTLVPLALFTAKNTNDVEEAEEKQK